MRTVLCSLLVAAAACGSSDLSAAEGGSDHPLRFRDTTGNVACLLEPERVQCDIADRQWDPGTPPEDCVLDWGNGIILDADGAEPTCTSDAPLAKGEKLEPGATRRAGSFTCEILLDGVACTSDAGTGFTLSRDSWRMW